MLLLSLSRLLRRTALTASSLLLVASGSPLFGLTGPSANDGFDPSVTGSVYAIAVQPNGKIILGGNFSSIKPDGATVATAVNGLVRTNVDGTLDTQYFIGPSGTYAAEVDLLALQADGSLLVAGNFSTPMSSIANFARFTPQGTLDQTFVVGLSNSAFPPGKVLNNANVASITALAVEPNGQILIGGNFDTVTVNGTSYTRNHIARLNANGSIDVNFNPNANAQVDAFCVTPSGQIMIGGSFTTLQPNGSSTSLPLSHIALLNSDGSTSATFDSSGNYLSGFAPTANNQVSSIVRQPDGNFVIAGAFTTLQPNGASNFVSTPFIARILPTGALDSTFQPATSSSILSMVIQADGQLVVVGNFQSVSDAALSNDTRNYIARINPDGSTDAVYAPNANFTINAVALQADGKVVVGGAFTQFHPQSATAPTYRNGVARIDIDGTIDSTFDPSAYGGIGVEVTDAAGNVYIGGSFSSVAGTTVTNIARLKPNGQVDTTFNPAPNGSIAAIAIQADGNILIGGAFTTLGGISYFDSLGNTIVNLARVSTNGTVDTTFNPSPSGSVSAIVVQPNQDILVGGDFETVLLPANSTLTTAPGFLVRLLPNGTPDPTFVPNPSGTVNAILLEPSDGAVIIGGSFQTITPNANGVQSTANYLARLNINDGTLDTFFNQVPDNPVTSLALQPDGKILVAGAFANVIPGEIEIFTNNTTTGVTTNNLIPRNRLYRVNPDGTLDTSFNPNADGTVFSVAVTSTSSTQFQIWASGIFQNIGGGAQAYLARLTAAGTLDPTFNETVNGDVRYLYAIPNVTSEPHANEIVAGGAFTSVTTSAGVATVAYHVALFQPTGLQDTSFSASANLSGAVTAIAVQPNGNIVLGGAFTNIAGVYATNIARIQSDNTFDSTFSGDADGTVNTITVNPNGSLYVGGYFKSIGGQTGVDYLARLNADGTLDTNFAATAAGPVNALVVQPNGYVVFGGVGGAVQPNGTVTGALARANYNGGGLDTTFTPTFNGAVNALALTAQPSTGQTQIFVGGSFTQVGNTNLSSSTSQAYLARLNADGSLDATFLPTLNGTVNAIVVQTDGAIVIGGAFTTVNGTPRHYLARLTAAGNLDPTFNPAPDGIVYALTLQSDPNTTVAIATNGALSTSATVNVDDVLVGGAFNQIGGVNNPKIARILYNGTLDPTFNPQPDNAVTALGLQEDGKVILGGTFANVGGLPRNGLARLSAEAISAEGMTISPVTTTSNGMTITQGDTLTWNYGGQAPDVSSVLFQVSTDNSTWTNLGTAVRSSVGPSSTWTLPFAASSALPSGNFFIRALGVENTAEYGSAGVVNFVQIFDQNQPPTLISENTLTVGTAQPFVYTFGATNSPTTYSAVGLPPGISLNSTTGVMAGMPTQTGTYAFTVYLTSAGAATGTTVTSATSFTINVIAGNGNVAGTPATRLVNISTLTDVEPATPITEGFIITGPGPKTVLLRGVGPGLTAFGVTAPLDEPTLTLYDVSGQPILSTQTWGDSANGTTTAQYAQIFTATGAFPLAWGLGDAAVVTTLAPGAYTLSVTSGDGTAGTAIAEVYDAGPTPLTATGHVSNVSANGQVYAAQPLTAGFIVDGATSTSSMHVLVRAIGPSLANFNISGAVPTPVLSIYTPSPTKNAPPILVAQNTGWGTQSTVNPSYPVTTQTATIVSDSVTAGAFSLVSGTLDSVLDLTLPTGSYTAQVTDSTGNTGPALIEVYSIPP